MVKAQNHAVWTNDQVVSGPHQNDRSHAGCVDMATRYAIHWIIRNPMLMSRVHQPATAAALTRFSKISFTVSLLFKRQDLYLKPKFIICPKSPLG